MIFTPNRKITANFYILLKTLHTTNRFKYIVLKSENLYCMFYIENESINMKEKV